MSIELFDAQCGFGGMTPGDPILTTAEDLCDEMSRLQIATALARTAPEDHQTDVPAANAALFTAQADHPSLVPCPIVVPGEGDDLLPQYLAQGSGAVCVRPSVDYWTLAPWVCDRMFRALQERRAPVICLERFVGLEQVGELAERFPTLPLIVAGATYRQQRMLLSLLEAFPSVYLTLGSNYTVHRGLEELVGRVGPERLLFGTGFPQAEAMPAITQLLYAEISDDQKRLIGAANVKRLIAGIAR